MNWNNSDVLVIKRDVRVTLKWIGEGWSGDYDPNDKEDEPLMRFCVERKVAQRWEAVDGASYCTRIPADISKERKIDLAQKIMDMIYAAVKSPGRLSPKKISESLSWIDGDGNLQ